MTVMATAGSIVGVLLAGLPLLAMSSAADPTALGCPPGSPSSAPGTEFAQATSAAGAVAIGSTAGLLGLDRGQLEHAATVIAVGRRRGIPDQGIAVALATALQESRLRVYANDGRGADLTPDQHGIDASLRLAHEAVGTDHGSLGIFQQQWPWWGPMADLMDPAASAGLFYDALMKVSGWRQLPVTVAAQRVQRSAYPEAYADDEPVALRLLADLPAGHVRGAGVGDAPLACAALPGGGTAAVPLPTGSGYVDRRNFGETGARWTRRHTGTDFSVACGTPVLAATSGTVEVDTDQPWAGPWLVRVTTGLRRVSTWYAHLEAVTVPDGAVVRRGQQIGEVGDLGNATGCHLHFEVHPRGGTIYQDPVDPTTWLGKHVGRRRAPPPDPPNGPAPDIGNRGYRVATFNVLGHSHTARGGNKPAMDASGPRMRATARLLRRLEIDVVALQELEHPQEVLFRSMTTGWSLFRGSRAEAVAWRDDEFAHLRSWTVPIPYFDGAVRRMPVVALRHRDTGDSVIVTSFHNPASVRRRGNQQRHRDEATRREVALAAQWRSRGHRIFILGDMNERHEAFCRFTATGALISAAGGSHHGPCRPPAFDGIDHIFATPGTPFAGFTSHRDRLTRYASDHPLVAAAVGW